METNESTTTTAPVEAAIESTEPIAATPPAEASGEAIASAGEAMKVAAYTPNFKYKYTGKNGDKWGDAEGEFDEPIKAAIKSKEDEEKWQKLYSKANGFEFVQEGRDKARTELKEYQTKWSPIVDLAQKANKAYTAGDMDSFFEVLGLPKDAIQKYVLADLQRQELAQTNPQQYQLMTQNQQYQRQLAEQQERMSQFEQKNLDIQSTMLHNELLSEYTKPNVSSFQQAFDAKNGQGAFDQEVRSRGEYIYNTQNGKIAKPSEVINELINKFGFNLPSPAQPQAAAQSQTVLATQKPTIPVVGGGGQSPSAKTFKTVKEMRAYKETL